MVTEGVGSEAFAALQSASLLRAFSREGERVTIGQSAGDSEDGVKALQHDGTQHHFTQVGLHR